MTFVSAILATLLLLPHHKSDVYEPDTYRENRMSRVAESIANACNQVTCTNQDNSSCRAIYHDRFECSATLIQQAFIESGLAEHVMSGECKPHECDRGKAIGIWQIHRAPNWSNEQWEAMQGDSVDALTEQALRAARLIAGGVGQCGSLAGALSRYNNGRRCEAYKFEAVASRIQALAIKIRIRMN